MDLLILLALATTAPMAFAEVTSQAQCTTLSADSGADAALPASYPVRSQGLFDGCQSYAASIMADAWLLKNKKVPAGRTTSPVATYLRFLQSNNRDLDAPRFSDAMGGTPTDALHRAVEPPKGSCSDEAFKDVDAAKFFDYSEDLRLCQVKYKKLLAELKQKGGDALASTDRTKLLGQASCIIRQEMDIGKVALDSTELAALLESQHYGQVLYGLVDKACSQPGMTVATTGMPSLTEVSLFETKTVDGKMVNSLHPENMPKVKAAIIEALKGGMPAAMAYCSKYVTADKDTSDLEIMYPKDAPSYFMNLAKDTKFDVPKIVKDCGPHVSALTRREWRNGKCMYLIHNSWGADCKNYGKNRKPDCNAGKLWVDESELMDNIMSVSKF